MKKIIALLLAFSASASVLCACSNDNGGTESKPSDNESAAKTSLSGSSTVDESDLFSFVIKLDGKKYTLPCDKSEFEKNGFCVSGMTADDTPDSILKPGDDAGYHLYKLDKDSGYVIKWDEEYSVSAHNFTQEKAKLKDVPIYSFSFSVDDDWHEEKGPELKLPGDLVFNHDTTEEDIIAAYGEPQDIAYNKDRHDDFVITDLDYKKREGDFIKNVHFEVVDQSEASANGYVYVLFQYVHKPEGEE